LPKNHSLIPRICCYHIATLERHGQITRISMEITAART